jgi:23S rRNA G2069 N7-methylase RlmK/C1962 C5-methylase RlmI
MAASTDPFANRLSRMARHWHRWARRQGITCYRIYDRDVPDVPLAIDWYEGHLLVTEHDRPHGRTEIEQLAWLDRMIGVVSETLGVARGQITLVPRWPRAADVQTRRQPPRVFEVQEHDLRFEVHLGMAKETGLELDQRTLRGMLRSEAAGKRVLNLFGRTATATLAAAHGGASSTTTVEASDSLVAWARRNLQLGGWQGPQHRVICQDPRKFLGDLDPADGRPFDLAIMRPPSFDGTRRPGVWNVQDGHVELVKGVLACLSSGGKIYFVTTFRRLTFHASQIAGATVREITRQTVPPDFRNKKVHRAWTLVRTP